MFDVPTIVQGVMFPDEYGRYLREMLESSEAAAACVAAALDMAPDGTAEVDAVRDMTYREFLAKLA